MVKDMYFSLPIDLLTNETNNNLTVDFTIKFQHYDLVVFG